MTPLTGKAYYLEFGGVAITGDLRNFDPGIEMDTAESTAGGDTVRNNVSLDLLIIEPSGTFIFDNDASGVTQRAVLYVGNTQNLIWGEQGNASGKPKWGVVAVVTKANPPGDYQSELELEVEWKVTGKVLLFDGRSATF